MRDDICLDSAYRAVVELQCDGSWYRGRLVELNNGIVAWGVESEDGDWAEDVRLGDCRYPTLAWTCGTRDFLSCIYPRGDLFPLSLPARRWPHWQRLTTLLTLGTALWCSWLWPMSTKRPSRLLHTHNARPIPRPFPQSPPNPTPPAPKAEQTAALGATATAAGLTRPLLARGSAGRRRARAAARAWPARGRGGAGAQTRRSPSE